MHNGFVKRFCPNRVNNDARLLECKKINMPTFYRVKGMLAREIAEDHLLAASFSAVLSAME